MRTCLASTGIARRGISPWLLALALAMDGAGVAHAQAAKPVAEGVATSRLYARDDKACGNQDEYAEEGESFVRVCPGLGHYRLEVRGDRTDAPNYGIVTEDREFAVYLHLDPDGAAARYARADLYDEVLDRQLEWQLDGRGRPYAIIARATFYPAGAKKAKRKPVETAYLVRGLQGYEDLRIDVPASLSGAYVPIEQARRAAAQFRSRRGR